jgi:ribosomal RNA-processing protein 7
MHTETDTRRRSRVLTFPGYKSHLQLVHPSASALQSSINAYLSQFTSLESARAKLLKHARTVPDEDGFITVTRGGRAGPARLEEAEKKKAELEERRKNNGVKDDFYRFQNREKRKEAEVNLRKRFEEDRRRVERMRERRGRIRPEA